jgi:glycosyltransferase involved in cell wall biosynthesis
MKSYKQPPTMKILIIAHYHEANGSNRSMADLVFGLQTLGVEVNIVVPREGSLSALFCTSEINVLVVPIPWWMSVNKLTSIQGVVLAKEIWISALKISKIIKEEGIDLVYTNTSVTPVGALAAQIAGVPHVWQIREYGKLDFGLRFNFPLWASMRFLRSSDAIIVHAQGVKETRFFGTCDKVHLIYNGVATEGQFEQRLKTRESSLSNGEFTFLMASSFNPVKRLEAAIHALKSLQRQGLRARLILAGDGEKSYVNSLHSLVNELGLDSCVNFPGFLKDPYPQYFMSDCLLVCSDYEAFSRSALEAMSTALPVIGRASGGTPEIISEGETGFLFNNQIELVTCMAELITKPELARQMGKAGWKKARKDFTVERCAAEVYNIFKSVLGTT